MKLHHLLAGLSAASLLAACGGGECKLDDPNSCPSDQTCEVVQGREKPLCFAPVQLSGKVSDLTNGAAIANAQVTALDENGSPAASVATSDADGNYSLRIPSTRADEKGTPIFKKVALRASATNYATFPSGVRQSLPIDTSAATNKDKEGNELPNAGYQLAGGQADVALSPLPDSEKNGSQVSGTVELSAGQRGVLVVAEANGKGYSTIADNSGAFTIFNVPAGGAKVSAYARGSNYAPADINVEAGKNLSGVELKKSGTPTGTVTGSVSIVATTVSKATSVVLVTESTFNAGLVRGETPPGLRAPDPGTAPNVTGNFSIDGVPDGKYVVLAAFENDTLVRDPDPNISGTAIRKITVSNGTVTTDNGSGLAFKVTGALTVNSPGGGDALDVVTGTPTFSIKEYSSAKNYTFTLLNTFGEQVWTKTVPTGNSGDVNVAYDGATALQSGVYQFRATALGNAGNPISTTEDLRGVFRVE